MRLISAAVAAFRVCGPLQLPYAPGGVFPQRFKTKSAFLHTQALYTSTMAPTSKSEIAQWVDGLVAGHKVTVFAKTHCPYCRNAIDALRSANVKDLLHCLSLHLPQHVEHIEALPLCADIQDYLATLTGARSVPRVFVNGTFFGGGDDTVRGLSTGKLTELLKNCGAL